MNRRNDICMSYPFDWTGLEDFKSYQYDREGLPQVLYPPPLGRRYNPITIAQFGLYHLQRFDQTGLGNHRDISFRCGDWLLRNVTHRPDGAAVWIFDFDLDFYGPQAPWISAMAQGEAVSLLLRLALMENRNDYEPTARAAINVMDLEVAQNGVLDHLDDGDALLEEYPTKPPSRVLNGHIFALLGALDFFLYFGEQRDNERMNAGVQTLRNHWQDWDTGFWTRYDLHPTHRLASRMYQEVHIRQMRMLGRLFKEPLFLQVADRWQKMKSSPWCNARWLAAKMIEKAAR
jgi:heparosan-N-sulfate-glucuronate 5-epimerase